MAKDKPSAETRAHGAGPWARPWRSWLLAAAAGSVCGRFFRQLRTVSARSQFRRRQAGRRARQAWMQLLGYDGYLKTYRALLVSGDTAERGRKLTRETFRSDYRRAWPISKQQPALRQPKPRGNRAAASRDPIRSGRAAAVRKRRRARIGGTGAHAATGRTGTGLRSPESRYRQRRGSGLFSPAWSCFRQR